MLKSACFSMPQTFKTPTLKSHQIPASYRSLPSKNWFNALANLSLNSSAVHQVWAHSWRLVVSAASPAPSAPNQLLEPHTTVGPTSSPLTVPKMAVKSVPFNSNAHGKGYATPHRTGNSLRNGWLTPSRNSSMCTFIGRANDFAIHSARLITKPRMAVEDIIG